jgi:hypothetical protein
MPKLLNTACTMICQGCMQPVTVTSQAKLTDGGANVVLRGAQFTMPPACRYGLLQPPQPPCTNATFALSRVKVGGVEVLLQTGGKTLLGAGERTDAVNVMPPAGKLNQG